MLPSYSLFLGDQQSFQSLVVTPKVAVKDVILIVLKKLMITDDPDNFILVEKSQGKGWDRKDQQ